MIKTEQFVMAYKVEQDRLRAMNFVIFRKSDIYLSESILIFPDHYCVVVLP